MIRGIGIASLICSVFGCIWILVGLTLIEAGKARLPWDVILGIGVCMMMASILLIAKPGEHGERKQNWTTVTNQLRIINAVQWSAIGLAILVLNVFHKVSLLPWVISVVVGIHFLPLGFIMRLTSYKVLGIAILGLDFAVLALPPAVRYGYAALGTGLALLCGAAFWMAHILPVWLRRSSPNVTKIHGVEG